MGPLLIGTSQATVAGDIGVENRGKFALLQMMSNDAPASYITKQWALPDSNVRNWPKADVHECPETTHSRRSPDCVNPDPLVPNPERRESGSLSPE